MKFIPCYIPKRAYYHLFTISDFESFTIILSDIIAYKAKFPLYPYDIKSIKIFTFIIEIEYKTDFIFKGEKHKGFLVSCIDLFKKKCRKDFQKWSDSGLLETDY